MVWRQEMILSGRVALLLLGLAVGDWLWARQCRESGKRQAHGDPE